MRKKANLLRLPLREGVLVRRGLRLSWVHVCLHRRAVLLDPAPQVAFGERLLREHFLVRHEALQDGRDGHAVHPRDHLPRVVGEDRRHDRRARDRVEVRPDVLVHGEVHRDGGTGGDEQLDGRKGASTRRARFDSSDGWLVGWFVGRLPGYSLTRCSYFGLPQVGVLFGGGRFVGHEGAVRSGPRASNYSEKKDGR